MVAISRVQAVFTGSAVVGPASTSVFTTGPLDEFRPHWVDLWGQVSGLQPPQLTITIPAVGETYDSVTGNLTEIWSEGTTETMNGASSDQGFARGVGGRIVWDTQGLTNNRRVRGATYLVPMAASHFDTDGTFDATVVSGIQAAVTAFATATVSDFVIWTRPIDNAGGKVQNVVSGFFPDRISTLRSRRV